VQPACRAIVDGRSFGVLGDLGLMPKVRLAACATHGFPIESLEPASPDLEPANGSHRQCRLTAASRKWKISASIPLC